jgi:hypothetical protein
MALISALSPDFSTIRLQRRRKNKPRSDRDSRCGMGAIEQNAGFAVRHNSPVNAL